MSNFGYDIDAFDLLRIWPKGIELKYNNYLIELL